MLLCNVWVINYNSRCPRKNILAWSITLEKACKVVAEATDNQVYIIEII